VGGVALEEVEHLRRQHRVGRDQLEARRFEPQPWRRVSSVMRQRHVGEAPRARRAAPNA
jgi:hypothetical protein